jgi:hypothetical protein
MGLFGFGKKKRRGEEVPQSGFSSRRRRIISSTSRTPAVKGAKPDRKGSGVQPRAPQKIQSSAMMQQQVGQLKRGDSSALLESSDTEKADNALLEFILEASLGDRDKVKEAFGKKSENEPFIKIIVDEGAVNEKDLLAELSKKCMIPQGKLDKYRIRKKALECMTPEMSKQLMILPVDKLGQILSVAMVNPLNKEAVKTLGRVTGLRVKTVVCTYSEFIEHYNKHYHEGGEVEGSEESLDISVDEPQPISPEEFKRSLQRSREKAKKPPAPDKKAASTEVREVAYPQRPTSDESDLVEEAIEEAVAEAIEEDSDNIILEEVIEVGEAEDIEEVEEVEEVESDYIEVEEPGLEEEQFIEPIIEGIDMSSDEEDEIDVIEPVIIQVDRVGEEESAEDSEYIDALPVVEEEFRLGITLGSMDLFKKWEKLHTKKRIITLNKLPDEVFSFMPLSGK